MKARLLLCTLSLTAGAALLCAAQPAWWFGAALLAGGLSLASPWLERAARRVQDRLDRRLTVPGLGPVRPLNHVVGAVCFLVLLGVATTMLPDAALGDRPTDRDHTSHFFNTWELQQRLLNEGAVWGWSHRAFAGFPSQYQYPIGASLWVLGVQALSLGLLSLSQAYGVGIWLFWFFCGWSVYRFGREAFSTPIGLLAAVAMMTDVGEYRTGGFAFAVATGVWPQSLAMAFGVLAVSRLLMMARRHTWGDVGALGFFIGCAVVSHPMLMPFLIALAPVALLALALAPTERPWLEVACKLAVAYLVGTLIGAGWLWPFLSVSGYVDAVSGAFWATHDQLGADLLKLRLIDGSLGLVLALGLCGVIALLGSRRFGALLTALLAVVLVAAGSMLMATRFRGNRARFGEKWPPTRLGA